MSAADLSAAITLAEFKNISRIHDSKLRAELTIHQDIEEVKKVKEDQAHGKKKTKSKREKRVKNNTPINFPVEPTIVQIVKNSKAYTNHSYRDFSRLTAEKGDEIPELISDMSFPQKVHHILLQEEYAKYISWMPHGRAFKVHVVNSFERQVSLKYFGHARYSSFLRQLANHGFKQITKGADRNSYYHELILRGLPHLCQYMPRPKQNARRLLPDPENEPDFYKIAKNHPLPNDFVLLEKEKVESNVDIIQSPTAVVMETVPHNVAEAAPASVSQTQSQSNAQNIISEIAKALIAQQLPQETVHDAGINLHGSNLVLPSTNIETAQNHLATVNTVHPGVKDLRSPVDFTLTAHNQVPLANLFGTPPQNQILQKSLAPVALNVNSAYNMDYNAAINLIQEGGMAQHQDFVPNSIAGIQSPAVVSPFVELPAQQLTLVNSPPAQQPQTFDAYALTAVLADALLQQQSAQK